MLNRSSETIFTIKNLNPGNPKNRFFSRLTHNVSKSASVFITVHAPLASFRFSTVRKVPVRRGEFLGDPPAKTTLTSSP